MVASYDKLGEKPNNRKRVLPAFSLVREVLLVHESSVQAYCRTAILRGNPLQARRGHR